MQQTPIASGRRPLEEERMDGEHGQRLLAVDLDGTLLNAGGSVDPRDVAAIGAALAAGVVVTLATGRMGGGALGIARTLGLTAPLICADGGLLACARSGAALAQRCLDAAVLDGILAELRANGLAPFVLGSDEAYGDATGRAVVGHVASWAPVRVYRLPLEQAPAWRARGVLLIMGVGPERAARAAAVCLQAPSDLSLDVAAFSLAADTWAVRVRPPGYSKGQALAALAARLGVPRAGVAAIGDWLNDVSMLAWAGRSFAMGHAPPEVKEAARETLDATAETGGGVAEAIARWLGGAAGSVN